MGLDLSGHLFRGVPPGQGFQQGLVGRVDEQNETRLVVGLEVVLDVEGGGQQAGLGGEGRIGDVQVEEEDGAIRNGLSDVLQNRRQGLAGTAPVGVYLDDVEGGLAPAFHRNGAGRGRRGGQQEGNGRGEEGSDRHQFAPCVGWKGYAAVCRLPCDREDGMVLPVNGAVHGG